MLRVFPVEEKGTQSAHLLPGMGSGILVVQLHVSCFEQADFVGIVDEISMEKKKVRVVVSMFGRETPVELEFNQVEVV